MMKTRIPLRRRARPLLGERLWMRSQPGLGVPWHMAYPPVPSLRPRIGLELRWTAPEVVPGATANADVIVHNLSEHVVGIGGFGIKPGWGGEPTAAGQVETFKPGTWRRIGTLAVPVPAYVVGRWTFKVVVRATVYDGAGNWTPWESVRTEAGFPLLVRPHPILDVFVSRSNREEDRQFIDALVELIEFHGFRARTVGISDAPVNPGNVNPDVVRVARECAGLVALGTPRDLLADGSFVPSPWLSGESGVAFGHDKPIVTIHDRRVRIGGLAEREERQTYEPGNLQDALRAVRMAMPKFRRRCLKAKTAAETSRFWTGVFWVGTAFASLGIGYLVAKEEEK